MNLNEYFSNLKSSISSIDHYTEAINKPLSTSFFFFIVTAIILGIFNGINASLTTLPELKDQFYITLDELNQNFDKELEIIWADDQLEINQEHVNVYWPSTIDHEKYNLPSFLAIISNSETPPFESDLLINDSSLMYFNKNNFYSYQETSETQESDSDIKQNKDNWVEYPLATILEDTGSYSINKQNLPKIISAIKESVDQSFTKIQIGTTLIGSIAFVFSKAWFLIIESILVYFLFKIYNFSFSFKKIIKLNLNILVPTAMIDTVSNIFYGNLELPMTSIAFWTILTFISFNLKKIQIKKKKK